MTTNIRSLYQPRVRAVPSTFTGEQAYWLRVLADAVNALPPFSVMSGSLVSAIVGTLGVNLSSATSQLWVKQIGSGNTGWKAIA